MNDTYRNEEIGLHISPIICFADFCFVDSSYLPRHSSYAL